MPLEAPKATGQRLRSRFPRPVPPVGPGWTLYRIYRSRDPKTGEERSPFLFSSIRENPDSGGRYDLPSPHGTCSFARSDLEAWLEVFRSAGIVDIGDIRVRRLCVTEPPHTIPAADLLARAARGFGITGELHTIDDFDLPRRWAKALFDAGFRALRGKIRHDPTLTEQSLTLFDEAGAHQPFGWSWDASIKRLDNDLDLLQKAVVFGFRIAHIPYDVEIETPSPL